jgi:hypothetical protein
MPRFADRIRETTTTTGTGTVTLLGAATQHDPFAADYAVGYTQIPYAIVGQTGTEWETGYGTLVTSSTLSRDQVAESSNANSLVNFSAGTKDVFVTIHEHIANQLTELGLANAISVGNVPLF